MREKVRGQTQVPAKLTVEASNFGCDRAANGNTVGEGELSTAVVVRRVYSESRRTLLLCTTARISTPDGISWYRRMWD